MSYQLGKQANRREKRSDLGYRLRVRYPDLPPLTLAQGTNGARSVSVSRRVARAVERPLMPITAWAGRADLLSCLPGRQSAELANIEDENAKSLCALPVR